MLKVRKISDFGSGTPAVARLGPGVVELLKFSKIPKESQDRVASCTWDVLQILVPAQRLAKEVIAELDAIEERLRRDGIVFENFGRVVEVPSAMKLDKVADFIVRAKRVLVRAMELIHLFWGEKLAAAYYHKAVAWAREELGEEAPLTRMLDDDQAWIKHIIDLRNEEEHPSKGPFVRNYDVNVHEDGRVELVVPHLYDGTNVRDALTVFSEDLLTFVEELVALGVMHTFSWPQQLAIAEIPVAERDPKLPVRFRVTLNDEAARNFAAATRANARATATVSEDRGDRGEKE